jgi:hypothetical protein
MGVRWLVDYYVRKSAPARLCHAAVDKSLLKKRRSPSDSFQDLMANVIEFRVLGTEVFLRCVALRASCGYLVITFRTLHVHAAAAVQGLEPIF